MSHMSHDDSSFVAGNSPTPAPQTPQRGSEAPSGAPVSFLANQSPEDNSRSQGAGQSSIGAAASYVSNAVPTPSEDFKSQLEEAKATISRLRQQVEEQGLRQRKSDAVNQDSKERITTGTTGLGVQQPPANGVSVQIVAGLCLLCFLVAYLFF